MKLSIALCTFNGERFLAEQLRSLAGQARLPDELIVCDDSSTDSTVAILEQFARDCPFPVRIHRNSSNLGIAGNFTKAIGLCTGGAILTCDQDDVWLPPKLATIEHHLLRRPYAGLVFSDARRIDERGNPMRDTLWQSLSIQLSEVRDLLTGNGLKTLCRRNVVTGATMAFRTSFRDLVLPVPAGWVHDAWIALMIAPLAEVGAIREPLIEYRQHPTQQMGERRLGWWSQYRRAKEMNRATFANVAARFVEARDRLVQCRPPILEEKVRHAEARARMREPGAWRLPAVLGEWRKGNYSRFSRGWKAMLQDLFLP